MIKIKVYSVGKTKEEWLQSALTLYETRLKPSLSIEWILAKNDEQLKQFLAKEANFICLDRNGKHYSSEEFSIFLIHCIEQSHARLCFVIGGPEGLPEAITLKAKSLLSFSRLTFTHQMTRLILVEQIYRALEIEKNSSYHK
jgi:23S rRNA (pseudouridine1915-N3)-methyltransferase